MDKGDVALEKLTTQILLNAALLAKWKLLECVLEDINAVLSVAIIFLAYDDFCLTVKYI